MASLLVSSAPAFRVDAQVGPADAIEAAAKQQWVALEATFGRTAKASAPPSGPIAIVATRLPAGVNGRSTLGRIELRPTRTRVFSKRVAIALAHEIGHQFLLHACPEATHDRLFHEAFAVATGGEVDRWVDAEYLSVGTARQLVERAKSLDGPRVRTAIARLIRESSRISAELAPPILRRLERCAAGAAWPDAMTAWELAGEDRLHVADATVVLDRHGGFVLSSAGAAATRMPYGSTLKPFVVAGGDAPTITVACEPGAAEQALDGYEAVLRSCNPYFLAWGRRSFGRFDALFRAFGVSPGHVTETIGLRPTERISPFELAQAYRVLAESDPQLVGRMRENTTRGTLTGLDLDDLRGATKTGTVRDSASAPRLGWIVYVDDRIVAVLARADRAPRTFADELRAVVDTEGRRLAPASTGGDAEGPACRTGGLAVSISAGRLEVGRHIPATTRLCLGSATNRGAGVIEPNGRLRTGFSPPVVRAHNGDGP